MWAIAAHTEGSVKEIDDDDQNPSRDKEVDNYQNTK